MRRVYCHFILIAVLTASTVIISAGDSVFAWPFEGKASEGKGRAADFKSQESQNPAPKNTETKAPVLKATAAAAENDEDEVVDLAKVSTVPDIPKVPEIPKAPSVPGIESLPDIPSAASYSKAAGTQQDLEILKIQKQIKEIINLNDNLKFQYKNQAQEIQKISEQALAHKKILEGLKPVSPTPDEEVVKNEKINLIKKQTQESQDFISNLEKDKKTAGAEASPAASNATAKAAAPAR